jgi:aminoglycoside phosphotransferase (APT) family kinase protein
MNETEHKLSLETCQALLREIEPASTITSVLPMGAEGTHPAFVIEARTATGTALQLAVKCYSSQYGPPGKRAQFEFKTLQMLQKHAVPVPTPIYLDEEGALFGTGTIVTSFVAGKQRFSLDDPLQGAREMAQVLAQIHSVPVGASEKEWLYDNNDEAVWFRRKGVIPEDMASHPDGLWVWNEIEHLLPLWQPVPLTFVHTDYWIGQLLWEQGSISAVLDWEEAGYRDPAYDLAYCRMDLFIGKLGPAGADEFLRCYQAEMGRTISNLALWEYASTYRVMRNAGWLADCGPQLRDFIAKIGRE